MESLWSTLKHLRDGWAITKCWFTHMWVSAKEVLNGEQLMNESTYSILDFLYFYCKVPQRSLEACSCESEGKASPAQGYFRGTGKWWVWVPEELCWKTAAHTGNKWSSPHIPEIVSLSSLPPGPPQCAYPNTFLDHITVGSACINRHV